MGCDEDEVIKPRHHVTARLAITELNQPVQVGLGFMYKLAGVRSLVLVLGPIWSHDRRSN